MHIISKKHRLEFTQKYPDSKQPLARWHKIVRSNHFANFAELRETFPSADLVNNLVIFNIGGNKYRLIVSIVYRNQKVFVKHILTHKEYDKGTWKND